jgi:hypothetical protein
MSLPDSWWTWPTTSSRSAEANLTSAAANKRSDAERSSTQAPLQYVHPVQTHLDRFRAPLCGRRGTGCAQDTGHRRGLAIRKEQERPDILRRAAGGGRAGENKRRRACSAEEEAGLFQLRRHCT